MDIEKEVLYVFNQYINHERKYFYSNFFKTSKGEYGYGDLFLGVTVPDIKSQVKNFSNINFDDLSVLIHSRYHEIRLFAIFILVFKYDFLGSNYVLKKELFDFYLYNLTGVNNWDLVDSSAYKIVGGYLYNTCIVDDNGGVIKVDLNSFNGLNILYNLANSSNLWKRRIAIVSTFYFIKKGVFKYTIEISKILLNDEHDLIHKAVGWMLRELGKKDVNLLETFLRDNIRVLNRTTLRYAIEKFDYNKRKYYLNL